MQTNFENMSICIPKAIKTNINSMKSANLRTSVQLRTFYRGFNVRRFARGYCIQNSFSKEKNNKNREQSCDLNLSGIFERKL